jgi:hypothetical protein
MQTKLHIPKMFQVSVWVYLFVFSCSHVYSQNFPCGNVSVRWLQHPENLKGYPNLSASYIDSIPGIGKTQIVDIEPRSNAKLIHKIVYPIEMKRRGIEGKILFLVLIDKAGNCTEVFIKCAVGVRGEPLQDWVVNEMQRSSLPVIKNSQWNPAEISGKAVPCWAFVEIPYLLR